MLKKTADLVEGGTPKDVVLNRHFAGHGPGSTDFRGAGTPVLKSVATIEMFP